MAKKKKQAQPPKKSFNANPFGHLKGFAASSDKENKPVIEPKAVEPVEIYGSFKDEMDLLGVEPIDKNDFDVTESVTPLELDTNDGGCEDLSAEELFLSAMSSLNVDFEDDYDLSEKKIRAIPRRMKQLRQGRLKPEATLDLHGCKRSEVVTMVKYFLNNAQIHGLETVLVVTGRGLHSENGEPILRHELESYLEQPAEDMVAEWGRAPKNYGGDGALVLFVRQKSD